jgi:stage V sporulation protein AD
MLLKYQNVFIQSHGCAVCEKTANNLNQEHLDYIFKDDLCNEDSFEKGERALLRKACDAAIRKGRMHINQIDCALGADLNNQLSASHYFMRDLEIPFIGMYAACASSSLLLNQAAMMLQQNVNQILVFTSSHYAVASRQFRYPNTYGEQKKVTSTTTVTGAGAMILSHRPSSIRVVEGFIGRIIDWHYDNVSDMGRAMAPAVYENFMTYLNETTFKLEDFDCIATGDLSQAGFQMFCDLLQTSQIEVNNQFTDCGLRIFNLDEHDIFCGGSGPACSMIVLISDLLDQLQKGKLKRILLLGSGALFSNVAIYQKESIPCICHGIVLERCDL